MGALGAIVLAILIRMVVGNTMEVHVKQPNAEVYHRQDMKRGEFDYGYHVQTVNNQFQHKVKGPDDVTYGCYGYVDPTNRKHLVYYVADRMGYRIIFPNRATKIFTTKLADSLNKLDGAVKGKDYDEKVVEWNNLYMPESCFRLHEILEPAASNQSPVQQVSPSQVPVGSQVQVQPLPAKPAQPSGPALPQPTQYTVPTTARTLVQPGATSEGSDDEDDYGQPEGSQTEIYAQGSNVHGQRRLDEDFPDQSQAGSQRPPQTWQGSLPDINPANINLDQFNGHVHPIHTVGHETHGAGVQTTTGQLSTSQYSLNITQLLAQIEAVNSQVITFNMLLAGMASNPTAYSNVNEDSCRSVVQLLKTQKRTPQLVYVPILIPYTEGQFNINQPIAPAHSEAYRGQHHANGGCQNCRG